MIQIAFKDRIAIVTGAGGGIGRAHALALAERGAKVVVNEPDASMAGEVAAEIEACGGEAMVNTSDVTDVADVDAMVAATIARWARVDILINNAGILRDKSFAKMSLEDFARVMDVHLMGSLHCTKAVWPHMVAQQYGRILMTTSASGIYGNFGQANYGAAKSGLVGLMNVLAIEGERRGIRVNSLAPTAATQMTEGLLDQATLDVLGPEAIAPGALFLVSDDAPTKTILGAGAGVFTVSQMLETDGIYLAEDERTPENIAARWQEITDTRHLSSIGSAFEQTGRYAAKRRAADTEARSSATPSND